MLKQATFKCPVYWYKLCCSKIFGTVLLNKKPVRFGTDSGTGFTLISEGIFNYLTLNGALQHTNVQF